MDFDRFAEHGLRGLAKRTSRRGLFGQLGMFLAGAGALPLLPVARASAEPAAGVAGGSVKVEPGQVLNQATGNPQDPGNPTSCDYWRYCAIDGFLCSCCGGSPAKCPPGSEMAALTWIGTCRNPADNRNYIVSYNDCCGISSCGRCFCNNNVGDRPAVRPQANNDTNWCVGSTTLSYVCSTAVIIGVATPAR